MTDKHYDLTNNGIQEMADDLCAIERKFVLKAVREVLEKDGVDWRYAPHDIDQIMADIKQRVEQDGDEG